MAHKASAQDRPILLDDVVISFDRDHRSRVAALLESNFADRQIILLTHDREWYVELQRMLSSKMWIFQRLNPYSTPAEGITFATDGLEFATAKAAAKIEPIEALGKVRRIMDVSLSLIAEKIGLRLPYIRGDGNDVRTAGQFLVALERSMKRSFKMRVDGNYVEHADAIKLIRKMKPELALWGNRGTHSFSGSRLEAEELIDDCEALLKSFKCDQCDTHIGTFESTGGKVECRCGALRWLPE